MKTCRVKEGGHKRRPVCGFIYIKCQKKKKKYIETKSRLIIAQGWVRMGSEYKWGDVAFQGDGNVLK